MVLVHSSNISSRIAVIATGIEVLNQKGTWDSNPMQAPKSAYSLVTMIW